MKAVSIALFAGVVGFALAQPFTAANATTLQETVVYSFCRAKNCRDGNDPTASLIEMKGKLYGTTREGGDQGGPDHQGGGTVFRLDPSTGAEKVLHGFCRRNGGCTDGSTPFAGLTKVNGQLLGTTATGGYSQCFIDFSCGTVFSVNPATDTENVLYPFCSQQSCTDGKSPVANVIDVGGTLYGTTEAGGAGVGTIFSLDPTTGSETVLYSFLGGADGWGPVASLIDVKGTLYGTTYLGGGTGCGDGGTGCGTVFSFDPSTGVEKILYSFCQMSNCSDGQNPEVSLIYVKGQLYGTTGEGGNAGCGGAGCGTIFSLDLETGAEKVVYSFCSQQNCADGANASSSLIDVNGVLYGTTAYGGNAGCDTSGCGTVFSLDPHTGVETVVYAFCSQQNCSDGSKPVASLINVDGILYGTTETGGTHNQGTVFALTGVH